MDWHQLWTITSAPDNVPIVAMLFLVHALLRSYIWHCIGIPIVHSLFMAVHFWRIRKDGGISGPAPVVLESEMKAVRK